MQVKFKYDIVRRDLEATLQMPIAKVRYEHEEQGLTT
jgi:hypothetical protein